MAIHPWPSATVNKSSPSATNNPDRSRQRRRWRSLRISLSLALWVLVIIKKSALQVERRPGGGAGLVGAWSDGRQRLAGAVGKPSERVGVAHGDVGQDLGVEIDAGKVEAVHKL